MSIKTRIIIADDNVHICKFMTEALKKHNDIEILGIANTDQDEIRMIEELNPQIVITDLVRNHKYTGLEIIKSYFEKNSPIKFLVVSADRKEDVIKDGLIVAGYIEKSLFFDYELLYNEIKRIKNEIIDEEYKNWDKKYHTLEYIDLYSIFDEEELDILKRLDIELKNKKYTECELEIIKLELYRYIEIEDEDLDINDTQKHLSDKGVVQDKFDKIISKIEEIKIL